jgi:hypothetical protein
MSDWALFLLALAWSMMVKRLVIPLTAFCCLSEAALKATSSGVIGFLPAGVLGAWLLLISMTVGLTPVGWAGPVGRFGSGNLPEFP